MGEAVFATDADHRVVYWSALAEVLLGWPAGEAIGRTDSEVLQTETDAGQTAEIIAGLVARRPWSAVVQVRPRDGEPFPVRITASALREGGGEVIRGFVAIITDLRDVRRREARRSAASAMTAVARLALGVAQELRAGVGRLEGSVRSALSRVGLADPARMHLDDALRTVDATAALAAQLLAVGRGVVPQPVLADLRDVIDRGLPAVRLLAGDAIDVQTELDLSVRPVIIDRSVADQILLNLTANCCAAMPEGGRLVIATSSVEITRHTADAEVPAGSWILLELRDTRSPVSSAALDRFFEPFADLLPSGMGLAATHGLVTLSNGHITVEPGPGAGLVFRVYLHPANGVLP